MPLLVIFCLRDLNHTVLAYVSVSFDEVFKALLYLLGCKFFRLNVLVLENLVDLHCSGNNLVHRDRDIVVDVLIGSSKQVNSMSDH